MCMVVFAKRPREPPWGSSDLDHLQGVSEDSQLQRLGLGVSLAHV